VSADRATRIFTRDLEIDLHPLRTIARARVSLNNGFNKREFTGAIAVLVAIVRTISHYRWTSQRSCGG